MLTYSFLFKKKRRRNRNMKYISFFEEEATLCLLPNKVQLFTEMIATAWFYHGLRKVKDEREFNSLIAAGSMNTH